MWWIFNLIEIKRMKLDNVILRLKIKELRSKGFSISAIAKKLGASYKHCKNICEQEVSK